MLIYLLALAQAAPLPLNETHQQDIGCVAALAIIADEQRRGAPGAAGIPDVQYNGKRWAGIVGERIMKETGQPKEVVAFAMTEAAKAEQNSVKDAKYPATAVSARVGKCLIQMNSELAATEIETGAAAPSGGTDEPDVIDRRKAELREDVNSPQRIRFCDGMIAAARLEIVGREGADSRDARAMGRLQLAFESKIFDLPKTGPDGEVTADQLFDTIKTRPDMEEQVARCIRLGESLALALPPE